VQPAKPSANTAQAPSERRPLTVNFGWHFVCGIIGNPDELIRVQSLLIKKHTETRLRERKLHIQYSTRDTREFTPNDGTFSNFENFSPAHGRRLSSFSSPLP
jgi:hypothetical protein